MMPSNGVTDGDKCQIFEDLVSNTIKSTGLPIDLASREHQVYKDALAFLVEGMTLRFTPSQSRTMLNDLVRQIGTLSAKEARHLIDQQVSTLYQSLLAEKIADGSNRTEWEQANRIYSGFMQSNEKKRKADKAVEFGGVRQDVLPDWYVDNYISKKKIRRSES